MLHRRDRPPGDERLRGGVNVLRAKGTNPYAGRIVFHVSKWDPETLTKFWRYIDNVCDALRIVSGRGRDAAIAARCELSASQISNWRGGRTFPTQDSLRKLADGLGRPRGTIFILAGIATSDELDVANPDLTVTPQQIRRMHELYVELGPGRDRDDFLTLIERNNEWAESRLAQRHDDDADDVDHATSA